MITLITTALVVAGLTAVGSIKTNKAEGQIVTDYRTKEGKEELDGILKSL